jgi:hypothetical protein
MADDRATPVEAIVHSCLDHINGVRGTDKRRSGYVGSIRDRVNRDRRRAEVDVVVLDLCRPIGRKAPFDAAPSVDVGIPGQSIWSY